MINKTLNLPCFYQLKKCVHLVTDLQNYLQIKTPECTDSPSNLCTQIHQNSSTAYSVCVVTFANRTSAGTLLIQPQLVSFPRFFCSVQYHCSEHYAYLHNENSCTSKINCPVETVEQSHRLFFVMNLQHKKMSRDVFFSFLFNFSRGHPVVL